ncbi:MAG: DUF3148 domain-containing protein [Synechococcus sp. BS307-5m-G39]|nr:DUF3148 domain-containing protein [Synechococcus sp. PROS-7-1]MBL6798038.1 DUF3148 domain-containing protein [Synechococcus sp. BS307-5m-G39]MBL6800460.1 DUF3148 domain-containing protein [Synechococcus sp. BS307-5m-G37]
MAVSIGDQVRLLRAQPFLKSADPMPMLRPPDLVDLDEVGTVIALHPGESVAVRFSRGTFLLATDVLAPISDQASAE